MANQVEPFKINFRSDFSVKIHSDAGWATPFTLLFYCGNAKLKRYVASYDGTTYTNCHLIDANWLHVTFDDHALPVGQLHCIITYSFCDMCFATGVNDETLNVIDLFVTDESNVQRPVILDLEGETAPDIQFYLPQLAAEAERQANELERIANEEERESNEQTRQTNEGTRQSQEIIRQGNESGRESAEAERDTAEALREANEATRQQREAIRVNNEAERQDAELTREDNEETRSTNELTRISNEQTRQGNEQTRQTQESTRQSQESTRQTNEGTRQTQEATRQSNEQTRQTQETSRQAAEATRQQTFQTNEAAREATFETNEESRQQTFDDAEDTRDATFASKEDTRDEANAAALAAATELARLESVKANKDGFYRQMTVGNSLNLIDEKAVGVPREFTFDTACGDASISDEGTGVFEKLKGKTIVWNQMFNESNYNYHSGVILSNHILTANFIVGTETYWIFVKTHNIGNIAGHKLLVSVGNVSKMVNVRLFLTDTADNFINYYIYPNSNGVIITVQEGYTRIGMRFNGFHNGDVISEQICAQIFDLTQMFGAGNEPSTVAEFEALFPKDYYEYNSGQLLSFTGTGVKTVGFNQFNLATGKANLLAGKQYQITGTYTTAVSDAETLTIDSEGKFTPTKNGVLTVTGGDATTCVHLTWSGYRNGEYEEYWEETKSLPSKSAFDVEYTGADGQTHVASGLKSAGTAYDEQTPTQDIRRIGVVDLGSLSWSYDSDFNAFRTIFVGPKRVFDSAPRALLMGYSWVRSMNASREDKSFVVNSLSHSTNATYIKNLDYTDAASFKAAMAGVLLYYELETPVITTYEEPRNLAYKVADFGTEQLLPENGAEPTTTPINAVIKYNTDFPREIANLPKNYTSQGTLDNLLSAMGTAMGGTFTKVWDAANNKYTFTFTPNPTEE